MDNSRLTSTDRNGNFSKVNYKSGGVKSTLRTARFVGDEIVHIRLVDLIHFALSVLF